MQQCAFLVLLVSCALVHGQEGIDYRDGQYEFKTLYNDSIFLTRLTITRNHKAIFDRIYEYDRIINITGYDLDGNGQKEYLFDFYTGGAHCCTVMKLGRLRGDNFRFTDSIYWGNAGYEVTDLDKDGKYEIVGYDDRFAYAFTNYAQSFFSIAVYRYSGDKFYLANKDFEETVEEHIRDLKKALAEYIAKGFDCPTTADEETFNTDAGAVKAILAPITADYESIGEVNKGYALIKEVYKCPDRDKFIKILQVEYKLR